MSMAPYVVGLRQLGPWTCNASRSTVWRWVNEGHFPKPVKLSPGRTVWLVGELDQWLQS